jgi:hypothetical protein
VLALLDAYGLLVVATGNALFADAELPPRTGVKFLPPKSADEINWKEVKGSLAALTGIVARARSQKDGLEPFVGDVTKARNSSTYSRS